jgi:2-C-methyl-D-erythritol 4-phosphate cytidylyltransferase
VKRAVIITAGGIGKRMGADLPKQFIKIKGKTVLEHTIDRFLDYDAEINITVTLPEEWIAYAKTVLAAYSNLTFIVGGEERFHSIRNAIFALEGIDQIAVHDGVRPLASNDCIERAFSALLNTDAAIPVIDISESLRRLENDQSYHVNRSTYRVVQTPQCFKFSTLKNAYLQDFDPNFTDDASVVEKAGVKVTLVEGNKENIKITHPMDLKIAEVLL